jgi:hypothetical protein
MIKRPKRQVDKPIATSIRFNPEVKSALEKAAKEDARSVTSLVTKVMMDWLKARGYLK